MNHNLLTRKQLFNGIVNSGSKYVAARHYTGEVRGFNVAVAMIGIKKRGFDIDDKCSKFIGWYPCSFQEYISIKLPIENF